MHQGGKLAALSQKDDDSVNASGTQACAAG